MNVSMYIIYLISELSDTNQEHTRDRKRKRENTANDELTSTSICRHIGLVESSPICSICRLVSPIYMIFC